MAADQETEAEQITQCVLEIVQARCPPGALGDYGLDLAALTRRWEEDGLSWPGLVQQVMQQGAMATPAIVASALPPDRTPEQVLAVLWHMVVHLASFSARPSACESTYAPRQTAELRIWRVLAAVLLPCFLLSRKQHTAGAKGQFAAEQGHGSPAGAAAPSQHETGSSTCTTAPPDSVSGQQSGNSNTGRASGSSCCCPCDENFSRVLHTAAAQVLLHLAGVGKDASFCSGGVTAQSAACNPTRRFRLLLLETLRQGAAKYPSNYDIQGSVVTLHYAVAQGLKELGDDDRDPTMHKFIWPILATARSYLKYAVAAAASEPGLLSCADFIIATRAVGTAVRSATSEAPSAAIITAQAEIVQCTDPLLRCLLAIHTHCKDKLLPEQQPATGRAFQRASLHDIVDVLLFNAVYPAGLKRIRSALGVGAAVALLDLAVSSSLPAVAAVWKGELSGRDVWEKKEFSTSAGLLASAFNMLWLATVGEWYEPSTSVGHVIAEGADLGLSAGSAKLPWGPWEAAISDLLASWSQEDIPEPPGAVPLLLQILRASLACDASWRGDPPADLALPFDASFGPELVDRATYALAMHMCRKPSSPATLDSIADFLLEFVVLPPHDSPACPGIRFELVTVDVYLDSGAEGITELWKLRSKLQEHARMPWSTVKSRLVCAVALQCHAYAGETPLPQADTRCTWAWLMQSWLGCKQYPELRMHAIRILAAVSRNSPDCSKAGTLCLKGAADEILAVCRSPPDATSVGTVKELLGILQRLTARKAACEDLVQGNGWAVKAAALDAFAAQAVKAKIPKGQVARMNALRSALTEQLSQATRFRSAQQADAAFAALMAEEQQAVDQKAKQEAKAAAKKAKKQRAKQAKQAAQADAAASAAAVPDDDAKPSSLAAGVLGSAPADDVFAAAAVAAAAAAATRPARGDAGSAAMQPSSRQPGSSAADVTPSASDSGSAAKTRAGDASGSHRMPLREGARLPQPLCKDGQEMPDLHHASDVAGVRAASASRTPADVAASCPAAPVPSQAWQAAGISEDIICCPISQEPMRDPVICADGHTYERLSIEQWLAKHDTSPMTNEVLPTKQLIPNMAVRQLVQAFVGQ